MSVITTARERLVRDRLASRRKRDLAWCAALVLALVWIIALTGSYDVYLATSAVVSALLVLSVGLLAGDTGMSSLCQVSFAAIAAWIATRFAASGNPLPVVVELILSVGAAALFGAIVALPALRLRSVNLAVVTFGVASAVDVFLTARGFPTANVGRPGFASGGQAFLVFCLVCFVVAALVLGWLRRKPIGTSWRSIRNSERATAAMGVSVVGSKISAFAVSAAIAGLAGVLTVMQLSTVQETAFPPTLSLVIFAVAMFIGGWRWQGALLAGILSTLIPYLLSRLHISEDWSNVLFAVGAIQALASGTAVADAIWPLHRSPAPTDGEDLRWSRVIAQLPEQPARDVSVPTLAIHQLTVRYGGVVAVDGVDLSIPSGAILGVIGANGAGKTSLIDAVSGYVKYGGEVKVRDKTLRGLPQRRAKAGLRRTFQQDRVVSTVNVGAYLRLAAGRRLSRDELDVLLAFSGAPSTSTLVGQLEGATRRLLEVAASLAAKPGVVLLDEPVAGLSSTEALRFGQRLRDAMPVFGATALLIEHDVEFVRSVCDAAVVMNFGKVIARGTPESVLDDPAVSTAYLGEQEVAL